MRVLSVNVGLPRRMEWEGREFESGIAKAPVEGRVHAGGVNLEGDGQADRKNHGGPLRAVYAYSVAHYAHWASFLGEALPMGALGENLTVEGLDEATVRSGDRFRIGTAEFTATIPREPCFKFAALRGTNRVVAEMLRTGFSGWYLAISGKGEIEAGDEIQRIERDPHRVRIADLTPLLTGEPVERETLERALGLETLTPYWRAKVERRLAS